MRDKFEEISMVIEFQLGARDANIELIFRSRSEEKNQLILRDKSGNRALISPSSKFMRLMEKESLERDKAERNVQRSTA